MRGRVVDRGDCVVVETADAPSRVFTNLLVLPAPPRADEIELWTERFAAELPGRGHLALRWANQLGPAEELRAAGFDVHVLRTMLADDIVAPAPAPSSLAPLPAASSLRELSVDELRS